MPYDSDWRLILGEMLIISGISWIAGGLFFTREAVLAVFLLVGCVLIGVGIGFGCMARIPEDT